MTTLKVIRLRPEGAFRTDLRSDTLWGLICWGIRAVYGNERLEAFLRAYTQDKQPPLLLSSAFPYVQDGEQLEYFLPNPLFLPQAAASRQSRSLEERKAEATGRKKLKKLKWLTKSQFERLLAAGDKRRALLQIVQEMENAESLLSVRILSEERVHIGVNRLTGGTKMESGAGLVFHAEEKYVIGQKRRKQGKKKNEQLPEAGLYFLYHAEPETEAMMLGALRFMSHIGLGGNRSIGKGKFTVQQPEPFELQLPAQTNVQVSVSLCSPTEEDIRHMQAHAALTAYELETRQGETGFLYNATKQGVPCLKEGSVLPGKPDNPYYGKLTKVSILAKSQVPVDIPHDLYHYGFALSIPAYYPQPD
ncbi:MAG: type III-A CRISPR-associated RAMP protein Csm4 [Thermonema sp.]|uniref:type III-A CRISPR-associated RAMP protein Csm4 n=1 Tax=Thermonema sp. TaxID=2231181 RepID=UPI0021DE80EE|nr:type III-A CRISPR-associated RAMP protein Csm4 [Thermonema sp.]GIV39381.1 MAG: type III-A CRISPR-associated RAMP protein Csm4 [Thermonema sp.]